MFGDPAPSRTDGKISYVRDCPEHFAKVASVAPLLLRLSAPFVRDMSALPGGITATISEELTRWEAALHAMPGTNAEGVLLRTKGGLRL